VLLSISGSIAVSEESSEEDKKWWQKRSIGSDLHYPHRLHMAAMAEEGDSCLLCHPFTPRTERKEHNIDQLETIANEPLMVICHDCHVDDLRAPWRCNLCHSEPQKIWPKDHGFDYINRHGESARLSGTECKTCHLSTSFCTDCHFRRDRVGNDYHELGYQSRHGIDARMMPNQCGRCHMGRFCADCHRRKQ